MENLTFFFSKTRGTNPNPEDISQSGENSGGEQASDETAASSERETITTAGDGDSHDRSIQTVTSCEGERKREFMENPPADDVCPICFGNYDVPCRAPCGHWYCGSCILQYWNFSATLRPCKCPMCSQLIIKLMPEASLYHRHEAEINKVLRGVGDYNRLFVGGISGFMLKFLASPLYIKRMFHRMLNAEGPGVHLHELRLIATFLGVLYSVLPFDFLRIGHRNIIEVFDYSAFALSFMLYFFGLYLRRRRRRNVREIVEMQADQD